MPRNRLCARWRPLQRVLDIAGAAFADPDAWSEHDATARRQRPAEGAAAFGGVNHLGFTYLTPRNSLICRVAALRVDPPAALPWRAAGASSPAAISAWGDRTTPCGQSGLVFQEASADRSFE